MPVDLEISNQWIKSKRGPKNKIDSRKPYAFYLEEEKVIKHHTVMVFQEFQERS